MNDRFSADDGLLLAETLATRMCHDLSGQVNTLVGALETMRDDPEAAADAADLASDAGTALVRRLRLLRAAWGNGCLGMQVEEMRGMVEGVFGARVRLDLGGLPPSGSFSPPAARLTLNMMLLAAECLPAGGVVELAGDPSQDVMVRISGHRAAWPPGLAGMLADPAHARDTLRNATHVEGPRALQAPLTALIAHAAGLRVSVLMAGHAETAPPLLVAMRGVH